MNEHDSARLKDLLLEEGYVFCGRPEHADIVIFNTCSVRKHAEDRVYGTVGELQKLKTKKPGLIIGIIGCMAEAHKGGIISRFPIVDFLCGPADLDNVPDIIDRIRNGAGHIMYLEGYKSKIIPKFSKNRKTGKTAYVKIMEGCDNFCSYCIVPYVRGRERSRPSKEILEEIESLILKGAKNITLLGQNVNSYGRGLKEKISFPELLRRIDNEIARLASRAKRASGVCVVGSPRNDEVGATRTEVDFVTSHPKDADTDLFRAMADSKSILRQLHLPLQSGSNRILKKMNRGYTVERYKRLAKEFRAVVKGSTLTTDLMVGFPGEKERDFKDTLDAVKEIRFDAAFIFKYSPRPFAAASKFKDDVPEEKKKRRHALLLETQKRISLEKKYTFLSLRGDLQSRLLKPASPAKRGEQSHARLLRKLP